MERASSTLGITRCANTEFRWGERTYIMGILNLSPDSFSGDGLGGDIEAIVTRAKQMVAEGVDIIDIGGESTRPGTEPKSIYDVDEELRLVIPAIELLARELPVPLSIDTYKSVVARRAIAAGAAMLNDVWGLKQDSALAQVTAEAGVPIVLMSNQRDAPCQDIMSGVISTLERSISVAIAAGVAWENIIIDPGIGFGKTLEQNLEVIRRLAELKALGRPILLGTSRKLVLNLPVEQRLGATAASVAIGIANGADMVRVHDVALLRRVCRMSDAIVRRRSNGKRVG